jgi:type II secretory pathway pseudopilin PulG
MRTTETSRVARFNLRAAFRRSVTGFTLVELLLAVFLLTIGLIGLLSIFPIGADWTRQITEESIAQTVARDAMGVIETKYGYNDLTGINSYSLVAMPNLVTKVPVGERSYQYGAVQPFPTVNPAGATYFWTALVRLSPDQPTDGSGHVYDVYILVMKKGQQGDKYTAGSTATGAPAITMSVLTGARAASGEDFVPAVVTDTYFKANLASGEFYNASTRNTPQIGDYGIGKDSGTVFRQYADGTKIYMTQPLKGFTGGGADTAGEQILWVPPSDPMNRLSSDTTPSPLVYVFQKKLAF